MKLLKILKYQKAKLSGKKIWVFCHIQKTAGTTFQREISKVWFPSRLILPIGKLATPNREFGEKKQLEVELIEEQKLRRVKVKLFLEESNKEVTNKGKFYLGGHRVYGLADELGIPVQHFSFIREPISRLVSNWFHHKDKGSSKRSDVHSDCEQFIRNSNPLAHYIQAYLTIEETTNFFLRYVERFPEHPSTSYRKFTLESRKFTPDIYSEMQKLAFSRIDKAIPLITERFDDSLAILSGLMEKPLVPFEPQRVGKSSYDRDLIQEMLPDLRKLHPESTDFYNRQITRFEYLMERRSTKDALKKIKKS